MVVSADHLVEYYVKALVKIRPDDIMVEYPEQTEFQQQVKQEKRDEYHHPEDDDSSLTACNSCHTKDDKNTNLPESCLDCHDAGDIEGTEMKNSMDAFHDQCIACHKESRRGPIDCSQCHVM